MTDLKISELAAKTSLAGTEEVALADSGASKMVTVDNLLAGAAGGLHNAYAMLRGEKAQGSGEGVNSSNQWNDRNLSSEVFDPDNIVSLSSNQFTLAAGTYYIEGSVPVLASGGYVRARIYNVTDAADAIVGSSEYSNSKTCRSLLEGRLVLASSKTFKVQSYATPNGYNSGDGLGPGTNIDGNEYHTIIKIFREA